MRLLQHIALMMAAIALIAGSALSCCVTGHSGSTALAGAPPVPGMHHQPDAREVGQPDCHKAAGVPDQGGVDLQRAANSPSSDHTGADCPDCGDCVVMTASAGADDALVLSRIDFGPDHLSAALPAVDRNRPHFERLAIRPPATAPPIARSPVRLKQILIV